MTEQKLKAAQELKADLDKLKKVISGCAMLYISTCGMDKGEPLIITPGMYGSPQEKIEQALKDRLSALEKKFEEI